MQPGALARVEPRGVGGAGVLAAEQPLGAWLGEGEGEGWGEGEGEGEGEERGLEQPLGAEQLLTTYRAA